MPELPEVQTIVNELESSLPGRVIVSCNILRDSIVRGSPQRFAEQVKNRSIDRVERLGKYILINLSADYEILTHLRMTGKFILDAGKKSIHKHDRVIFGLDNRQKLIFSDMRCFGTLELIQNRKSHPGLNRLGMDPWNRRLTGRHLQKKLKSRTIPIKTALLDQKIIAGLGNIYASEILFDVGLDPATPANGLSVNHLTDIIRSTRKILKLAMKYNGTSISDYRRIDEKQGMFQNFLKVYGKENQKCIHCSSRIVKIVQNQRSTFLCPQCQKQS